MSIYRKIDIRIHNDRHFRALSRPQPCGQWLFVYLLTGPMTGVIPGVFEAREAGLADALGWSLEAFREAFLEVNGEASAKGLPGSPKALVKADWEAGLVWVPRAIYRNPPQAPNVVKSWAETWDLLPECDLKIEAYEGLRDFIKTKGEGFRKAFRQAIPKPSWKPSLIQEQEQEQEQEPPFGGMRAQARAHTHAREHSDLEALEREAEADPDAPPADVPEPENDPEPWIVVARIFAEFYEPASACTLVAHTHRKHFESVARESRGDWAKVRTSARNFVADQYAAERGWPPSLWASQFARHLRGGPKGTRKAHRPPAPHSEHGKGEIKV